MAARRIPPEVQKMFDKYTKNNVRRLPRDAAIKLLMTEFKLKEEHAQDFFTRFDADRNGQFSLWEFLHFYNVVGARAPEIAALFERLDRDGNGRLDIREVREGMARMKTTDGAILEPQELDAAFKNMAGQEGDLDLGEFIDLLGRLRYFGRPKPAHAVS